MASRLAEDVLHHLSGHAVTACPPSVTYQLRKFARRNRLALAVTGAILLALIAGTTIAAWQAIRATASLQRALIAERQARQEVEISHRQP